MKTPKPAAKPDIHRFEQCCWDVRGVLSRFGPDEVCCEGLTPRQCRVLRAVGETKDLNLSALAEREGLTVSGMSRRVDPLVRQGYLARSRDGERDGRALRLELTAKGRKALDDVTNTIYRGAEDLWRALPTSARPRVLECLELLVQAARETGACACEMPSGGETRKLASEPAPVKLRTSKQPTRKERKP
jgi:DNA-binding MarR family transcriptional regulator